jgi:hypothetical protein
MSTQAGQAEQNKDTEGTGSEGLDWWIAASPALGIVVVFGYAVADHFHTKVTFLSVFSLGVAVVLAALIGGLFLGFLFGLPRTLEQPNSKALLTTNTNLDQISDWLTKILVGLGLVQVGKISHAIGTLSSSLAPGLGGGEGAKALATALILYSAIDGFLVGYLWARIVLSKRLRLAADYLSEADKQLELTPEIPPPAPERIKAEVAFDATSKPSGNAPAQPPGPRPS